MGIRRKLLLLFAGVTIAACCAGLALLDFAMGRLEQRLVGRLVAEKAAEVQGAFRNAGRAALDQALLFSRTPEVVSAYREALSGNIDDERDPAAQRARERLRSHFAPVLAGYAEGNPGRSFQLHFHLPNGRSLARVWRAAQVERNGEKLDISDDLSALRPTVLEVNRTGRAAAGVENGREGFAIRGVAPVRDETGRQLGSVETLTDFAPVLSGVAGQSRLLLYLEAGGGRYALAAKAGGADAAGAAHAENLVTPELLAAGAAGAGTAAHGRLALGAFPVRDWRGGVVGVMVAAVDTSAEAALVRGAELALAAGLALLLAGLAVAGAALFTRHVSRPADGLIARMREIVADKDAEKARLPEDPRDAMARLGHSVNLLLEKFSRLLALNRAVLDAVPDPLVLLDSERRVRLANTATADFAHRPLESLVGRPCAEVFAAGCGDGPCALESGAGCALRLAAGQDGRARHLRPVVRAVADAQGGSLGWLNLVQDVTGTVEREEELRRHLAGAEAVNASVTGVSQEINEALAALFGKVEEATDGAGLQQRRVEETMTSMQQMTAAAKNVSENARAATEQARQARQTAQEGETLVRQAGGAIQAVRSQTEVLRGNMDGLGRRVQDIGRILTVISDIADQTNLLALNAAIEAARAGNEGRGFAVVADEVRKLAEKTMLATAEVNRVITSIRDETAASLAATEKAAGAVDEAAQLSGQSGETLGRIVGLVRQTAQAMEDIAAAAREQSEVSGGINKALTDVNAVSLSTAQGMDESSEALLGLSALAGRLRQAVTAAQPA